MNLKSRLLEGKFVTLEPLEPRHYAELKRSCDADGKIWPLYPFRMDGEHFAIWAERAAARAAKGEFMAFAVMEKGSVVGTTAFSAIDPPNKRVEIGNTYYRPEARGGAVNPESKLLLLDHAFSSGVKCVQFKVDALNARSRAAVLKLGAKEDGILRHDRIVWTGRVRDTVVFSILEEEWPGVRAGLVKRVAAFKA